VNKSRGRFVRTALRIRVPRIRMCYVYVTVVTDDVAAAVWSGVCWCTCLHVHLSTSLFLRGIYVCTCFALDDFVTGTLAQNPCIF